MKPDITVFFTETEYSFEPEKLSDQEYIGELKRKFMLDNSCVECSLNIYCPPSTKKDYTIIYPPSDNKSRCIVSNTEDFPILEVFNMVTKQVSFKKFVLYNLNDLSGKIKLLYQNSDEIVKGTRKTKVKRDRNRYILVFDYKSIQGNIDGDF